MREMTDYGEAGIHATVADTIEEAAQVLAGEHLPIAIVEFRNVIFNICSAKYSEFGQGQPDARVISREGAREYIFNVLEEISALGFACGG